MSGRSAGAARVNQKVAVSVVYVAAMFMSVMDTSIVNVALPSIGHDRVSIAFSVSLPCSCPPQAGWGTAAAASAC